MSLLFFSLALETNWDAAKLMIRGRTSVEPVALYYIFVPCPIVFESLKINFEENKKSVKKKKTSAGSGSE